jgi:glycyl-tRNA synthetase alpha subunit
MKYSALWRSYSFGAFGCTWELWHGVVVSNTRWYFHAIGWKGLFQVRLFDRVNGRVVFQVERKGK